jgi:SAM-dependent methyltransferase
MALDFNAVKVSFWAKNLGVSYRRTLTLGRQNLVCSPSRLHQAVRDFGLTYTREQIDRCLRRPLMEALFADEFFRFLGAEELVSVDNSDYEGATLIHDLNQPFPENLREHFDFVLDGGTLEHVFNYPTALRHCLELVRPGGHFLTITVASGFMGHGFYQFSPDLFFRIFNADNGFSLRKMILFDSLKTDAPFYQVNDPALTGQRTELFSAKPILLAALAQRTAIMPIFARPPQQSDYVAAWQQHDQTVNVPEPRTDWIWRMRKKLNPYWPYWLSRWKAGWQLRRKSGPPKLSNQRHFRLLTKQEMVRERSRPQNG